MLKFRNWEKGKLDWGWLPKEEQVTAIENKKETDSTQKNKIKTERQKDSEHVGKHMEQKNAIGISEGEPGENHLSPPSPNHTNNECRRKIPGEKREYGSHCTEQYAYVNGQTYTKQWWENVKWISDISHEFESVIQIKSFCLSVKS